MIKCFDDFFGIFQKVKIFKVTFCLLKVQRSNQKKSLNLIDSTFLSQQKKHHFENIAIISHIFLSKFCSTEEIACLGF